jgi:hypothetical protein
MNIREGTRRLLVVGGYIYWIVAVLVAIGEFNRVWVDFDAAVPYTISAPGIRPLSFEAPSGKHIGVPIALKMKWQVTPTREAREVVCAESILSIRNELSDVLPRTGAKRGEMQADAYRRGLLPRAEKAAYLELLRRQGVKLVPPSATPDLMRFRAMVSLPVEMTDAQVITVVHQAFWQLEWWKFGWGQKSELFKCGPANHDAAIDRTLSGAKAASGIIGYAVLLFVMISGVISCIAWIAAGFRAKTGL